MKRVDFGWIFEDERIVVFFGDKNFVNDGSLNEIPIYKLRQVHGDAIIDQTKKRPNGPEADGHFTENKKHALMIKTADCMPILIHAPVVNGNDIVMALHAGWKGIAQRIVPTGLTVLKHKGCDLSKLRIWIGPHIQKQSFEIKSDVEPLLLRAGNSTGCVIQSNEKTFFNLLMLVKEQIMEFGVHKQQILALPEDTYTSSNLHSHRRDKDKAGRLESYIYKK